MRPATLRRAFLGALVMNTVIVVTGGAVRLTASGLGCPTVPKCTADSMVATREMGIHGAIEFGNRLLTFVLLASVVAAAVAAWRARRRDLLGRAGLLGLGIVVQAVLGAITVLTELSPLWVMAHFLVSMVLIAVAVEAHLRTAPATQDAPGPLRALAWVLVAALAATLVVGTVVTGTGPHSGDKVATDRLPLDLESVAQLHADLVFLVLGLSVGLWLGAAALRLSLVRRRALLVVVVGLGQGLVGFVQYFTDLPVLLVGLHMLGACLLWIATLRAALAMRVAAAAVSGPRTSAENRPAPASATAR